MKYIRACYSILGRRGAGYFWYLLNGWLLPRVWCQWSRHIVGRLMLRLKISTPISLLREQAWAEVPIQPDTDNFTSWERFPVDPKVRANIEAARLSRSNEPFLIGRIDDDGRLLGSFGDLPGFAPV